MKKFIGSLLAASLLSGALSANQNFTDNAYAQEFSKVNQYFNSLMEANFNSAKLNNLRYPRTDIQNKKNEYIVKFDLAGIPKKNIKLSIDDKNVLTVEGEKKNLQKEKSKDYVKQEIFYGSFKRMMQLPEDIAQNKLQTKYENGILTVTIPKKELKKPKNKIIPIK